MNNETNSRPTTAAEYQYARKDIVERLEKEISGATDKPCGEGVRMLTQNCC